MPKIIIREYDNTKAGTTEYANFSVVVPGYAGTPQPGYIKEDAFDENGVFECTSQSKFINYIGKVAAKDEAAKAPTIDPMGVNEEVFDTYKVKGEIYIRNARTYETVGYLHTTEYEFTRVPVDAKYKDYKTKYLVVILAGNEGNDVRKAQFGNQIAYELLGLGYTVLFKEITGELPTQLADDDFWSCFKDKASYDFRYICTGGYTNTKAYNCIYNIANHVNSEKLEDTDIPGRGDCVALIDVDETGFAQNTIVANIKNYVKTLGLGKYAAIFCPRVTYAGKAEDVDIYKNLTFPASFHYLACAAYARNELNFNEWYAVAGYTRGVCSKTVSSTSFKLGEIAINALEPRTIQTDLEKAVNLVTNIRGNYYIWGNRTAHKLDKDGLVASHFLNIRQLCCTLKKQLYVTCRKLTFNPNSDILWGDFCSAIRPILEKMKADQGISNYKIIKVKETRKALLTAKIRIVPIEAVEDFDISIYLENDISGVKVGTEE